MKEYQDDISLSDGRDISFRYLKWHATEMCTVVLRLHKMSVPCKVNQRLAVHLENLNTSCICFVQFMRLDKIQKS